MISYSRVSRLSTFYRVAFCGTLDCSNSPVRYRPTGAEKYQWWGEPRGSRHALLFTRIDRLKYEITYCTIIWEDVSHKINKGRAFLEMRN